MCQAGTVVFVYGTLMAPEVLQVLIKRVPRSQPGGQPMEACMQATVWQILTHLRRGQHACRATSGVASKATSSRACSLPDHRMRSMAWCVLLVAYCILHSILCQACTA